VHQATSLLTSVQQTWFEKKSAVPTLASNNEKTYPPGFKVPRECIAPSVIMLWGNE